ncbi:hypothetical protein P3W85_23020 [Cupriavidus basilensis]|uniref:Uncharacterized protein n=1 Tax=Cupriavidus basilensis TaxID=68895 RepID=A0ABT6AT44_9BURK|nr:hypothetical protein [Cupriavidus basilensis]MDF3835799.1 hypothetical protein [Cupriavidus basilensis]
MPQHNKSWLKLASSRSSTVQQPPSGGFFMLPQREFGQKEDRPGREIHAGLAQKQKRERGAADAARRELKQMHIWYAINLICKNSVTK